ncbi:MAG: FIG00931903: hypothetical protein [uncultured Ramlibacter sp.]|uniref:Serine endopeptidase n=1 Tax=uncultured Ramlibacter sp. TaxID=260755 RepID=A0A6J4PLQ0_9BURK|nr:MAG: FIG00931903: hypothetical protein [uncultured Ramlibacter sp.]
MGKPLRLSEKWFRRGLWVVAVVFAGFLVGLGGTLVGDLPKVERRLELDDFLDRRQAERLRAEAKASQRVQQEAQSALQQAQLKLQVARSDANTSRESLSNWLATRRATQLAEQDPELVARTRSVDALKQTERTALAAVEQQQQALLDARQNEQRASRELSGMEQEARKRWTAEARKVELRVFLYRLALTLPLLLVAGWLFHRHRKGTYWPFVWGFIFFALFTFFVELVPYLPSYGGYVRYAVGILVTVVVGRQAIHALNRYLERQRLAEQLPDAKRREELPYDIALVRVAKGVCPGCERPVDLKDQSCDFCPHCGIGLFNHCGHCGTRKSTFSKFCRSCGTAAGTAAGGGITPLAQPAG